MAPLSQRAHRLWAPGLSWSHDVLHRAGILLPDVIHRALEEGRQPVLEKPLTLAFKLHDVREPMLWAPQAPTEDAANTWQPRTPLRAGTPFDVLLLHDRNLLFAQHAYTLGADARAFERLRSGWGRGLGKLLREGLEQRVGRQLDRHEERVFIHLAARAGGCPEGIRVCEWCLLVFERPRAKRCDGCRDKGRVTAQPDRHETTVMFGHGDYRELQFVGECEQAGCTARFQSADARTRYCREHSTPAAYTRRSRAGLDGSKPYAATRRP